MKILLSIFFLFFPFFLRSADQFPSISGCFCEGGLIFGKVKKDDSITVDKKKIMVFENGEFVFAFGRKFKQSVAIIYNTTEKNFSVKKKEYKIERINDLPKNKVEPKAKEIKKIKSDKKKIGLSKQTGEKRRLFDSEFILPAKGRMSGFFGSQRILNNKPRSPHNGIDIAAPEGSEVYSPSSGKIKLVEMNMFFTGNTLIIDHGLGLISIFAHLKEINVKEGELVKKGEKIGLVGMTGRATGPHLHWGVYLNEIPIDPMELINHKFF